MLVFKYGDYDSVINDFNYETFAQNVRDAAKDGKETIFFIGNNLAVCVVLREIALGNVNHEDVVFEKQGDDKEYRPRRDGSFERGVHFTVGAALEVSRQLALANRIGIRAEGTECRKYQTVSTRSWVHVDRRNWGPEPTSMQGVFFTYCSPQKTLPCTCDYIVALDIFNDGVDSIEAEPEFEQLDALIEEIRSQKPLEGICQETRMLARRVAEQPRLQFGDKSSAMEWARSIAKSVSRADD